MNWPNLDAFLSMGGHGLYVWGSYAFASLAMLVEPGLAWLRHRRALYDVADQHETFKE
jgi:heme exporter protein D